MSLHSDLLAQAKELCEKERRRPKQASLRRAVSTAYYALFHCLVEGATCEFVSHKHRKLRPILGRVFEHRKMADAFRRMQQLAAKANPQARKSGRPVFSQNLLSVAEAFLELQQARHEADYDLNRRFTRTEAVDLVSFARFAISAFGQAQGREDTTLLLIGFLDPRQIGAH